MMTRFIKIALIAGLVLQVTTLTGCFKRSVNSDSQSSSGSGLGGVSDTGDFVVVSGLPTAQILTFRGVLKSYAGLAGVTPSNAALSLANSDALTYSLDGSPTSVTAPMMFSQAKLGAEVCLTLVNKEKGLQANA